MVEKSSKIHLVSILIPAFNAGKWIAATIRCASAQRWPHKEIIVVDDGSLDNTLAIAERYEGHGIRVVSQKNQGAAAARNHALSLSRGDYIQWLDADDLIAPDKIARQMEAAQEHGTKRTLLSSGWGSFIYRAECAKITPTRLWCHLAPVEWLLRKMGENLFMPPISWLVSRELTEAAGPWDNTMYVDDDGEYFCRVLLRSDGVRFVPNAMSYYRQTATMNRVSYIGQSAKKLEAQWRSLRMHIGYIRALEDSERVRAACVKFLQNWVMYFHPDRQDIIEEMRKLAADLGGELRLMPLPGKYRWIAPICGAQVAQRAQLLMPQVRWKFATFWDRVAFELSNARQCLEIRRPK